MQTVHSKAEPPRRKRRRFQFSLRSLLIVVTLVGIVCGWLGSKIDRKVKERKLIEAIVKRRGVVWYDFQCADSNGRVIPDAKPPGPDWLRSLLGENFFSEVRAVLIAPGGDSDLQLLAALPRLQSAALGGTTIIDNGLAHLKGLTQLEYLDLQRTGITDIGLRHLTGLMRLQELKLDETKVTDAGLANLSRLPRLQWLTLFGTNVTDAGVKTLQKSLPNCTVLHECHR